ncbi:hypothetical protein GGR34_003711 [Microvirga flocculans]|uniref:Uncharacterized protein n=1 Tax=Microvirga flocculans TaxID=217168 RepID=A0A7W6IJ39_9HYPH|nr:hypothetical protein [Microvirga flocculans]MBB4042026.1 hypothetical protein [Microvirga flocculans]
MAEDWISITEAAARLTAAGDPVDRSTLSRYLKQHAEALPTRAEGKSNLVDFERLVAHRAENIRLRTGPAAPRMPAAARAYADVGSSRFTGSQTNGAARKANADAELREMDLALRRKQLTVVAEVDQAGRDAVALMQSAFERAVETEAAALAMKYGWDERTVRLALKTFTRRGLEVFNREILDRLDAIRRDRDAAEAAGEPLNRSEASPLQ